MDEAARRLNQAFKVIRILGCRPQPEMLEHVMRFIITLLIPAAEESQVTRMLRDVVARRPPRSAPVSSSTSWEILWSLFTESLVSRRLR